MQSTVKSNRMHPLVAGAAISIMLVSLTGVAAITGIFPKSHSGAATAASAPTPVAPIAAPEPATAAPTLAEMRAEAPPKPAPVAQKPRPRPVRTAQPARTYSPAPSPVAQAPATCANCGRVASVQVVRQAAQPSGLGMIAGAVLGGALGNQVGGGSGRKIATVAGAVGGGYAGNEVEKNTRATVTYQVHVRMESGEVRTFPYPQQPGWNAGDRVRVVDGRLTSRA